MITMTQLLSLPPAVLAAFALVANLGDGLFRSNPKSPADLVEQAQRARAFADALEALADAWSKALVNKRLAKD